MEESLVFYFLALWLCVLLVLTSLILVRSMVQSPWEAADPLTWRKFKSQHYRFVFVGEGDGISMVRTSTHKAVSVQFSLQSTLANVPLTHCFVHPRITKIPPHVGRGGLLYLKGQTRTGHLNRLVVHIRVDAIYLPSARLCPLHFSISHLFRAFHSLSHPFTCQAQSFHVALVPFCHPPSALTLPQPIFITLAMRIAAIS